MSKQLQRALVVTLLTALGVTVGSTALASAAPVNGGALKNGKPLAGSVSTGDGAAFTFTTVANRHLTINVTDPQVAPAGARLKLQIFNSTGALYVGSHIFGTDPIQFDFTPSAANAGTNTIVVSPYDTNATGSFTITYANDIKGPKLKNRVAGSGKTKFPGQRFSFTFRTVANRHLTINVTDPQVAPAGARLKLQIFNSTGALYVGSHIFGTDPIQFDFTPSAANAGTNTIVISAQDTGATGSFTITYANDIKGPKLKNGVAASGKTKFPGQRFSFTFTTVANRHLTINITRPHIAPAGARLKLQIFNSTGALYVGSQIFGTDPIQFDFTPSAANAGTNTIVISAQDTGATGRFTITYADDVDGGELTAGTPVKAKTTFQGQRANFTFTAIEGVRQTLNIAHPHVTPAGARLKLQVFNSTGSLYIGSQIFGTDPITFDFTPSAANAGTNTIVISPYDTNATGSFTITYRIR